MIEFQKPLEASARQIVYLRAEEAGADLLVDRPTPAPNPPGATKFIIDHETYAAVEANKVGRSVSPGADVETMATPPDTQRQAVEELNLRKLSLTEAPQRRRTPIIF